MAHDLRAIALTSRRLELKSFSPADAPDSFAVTTSTLTRYMGWLPSTSPEAFAEVWREWLLQMKAGTDVYLVIRLKVTGDFLGMVGLHGIGPPPTIGIWVKEAAHGLGYGREAVAPTRTGRACRCLRWRTWSGLGSHALTVFSICPRDRTCAAFARTANRLGKSNGILPTPQRAANKVLVRAPGCHRASDHRTCGTSHGGSADSVGVKLIVLLCCLKRPAARTIGGRSIGPVGAAGVAAQRAGDSAGRSNSRCHRLHWLL